MIRSPAARNIAKRLGTVALSLIALDCIATLTTLVLGWGMFKR